MKKIGIIGGVAWQSTVEYYRLLCAWTNAHYASRETGPARTPPMMIESLVMRETRGLRGQPGDEASWAAFDAVIRQGLLRLQEGGCDFAILANNTFHMRLEQITQGVDLEVLSILDAVADATAATGATKALVLGTAVTMRSNAYADILKTRGVTANAQLDDVTIDDMQHQIDHAFHSDPVPPQARRDLLAVCEAFAEDPQRTAILLACTELPLAFPDHLEDPVFESDGFTFINTTAAHIRAALAKAMA
ncbi:MAG: aspartate/glutamate racemase family protein [Pseudomonadota bacterium]